MRPPPLGTGGTLSLVFVTLTRSDSQMINAISGPLRSKRIHIGMDEAHGVSEGRYRQIFGYKDSTQVVSSAAFVSVTVPCARGESSTRHVRCQETCPELTSPFPRSSRRICAESTRSAALAALTR